MTNVERLLIFVASPSDVSREREYVEHVVAELNRSVAFDKNVVLQVIRWERNTFPAYGNDPQALVNAQIGEMAKCALFVGIMWSRAGTRTPRAESGTIEEFERAVASRQRYRRPEIWFYFRTTPISFGTQDQIQQAANVLAFKKRVQKRGLTPAYKNPGQFKDLFRQNVTQWLSARKLTPTPIRKSLNKPLTPQAAAPPRAPKPHAKPPTTTLAIAKAAKPGLSKGKPIVVPRKPRPKPPGTTLAKAKTPKPPPSTARPIVASPKPRPKPRATTIATAKKAKPAQSKPKRTPNRSSSRGN
jgi:hypothetical protein